MVQTFDISNLDYFIINSLKYLRSTALGYKDIEIRKSEFVAKTQLLCLNTPVFFDIDGFSNGTVVETLKMGFPDLQW